MVRVARWVSILAHPFVMVAAMAVATALHFGTRADAIHALAVVTLFTLLPLAILMVRQVRRGSWSDVDASKRTERPLLFVVGLTAVAPCSHTPCFSTQTPSFCAALLEPWPCFPFVPPSPLGSRSPCTWRSAHSPQSLSCFSAHKLAGPFLQSCLSSPGLA